MTDQKAAPSRGSFSCAHLGHLKNSKKKKKKSKEPDLIGEASSYRQAAARRRTEATPACRSERRRSTTRRPPSPSPPPSCSAPHHAPRDLDPSTQSKRNHGYMTTLSEGAKSGKEAPADGERTDTSLTCGGGG